MGNSRQPRLPSSTRMCQRSLKHYHPHACDPSPGLEGWRCVPGPSTPYHRWHHALRPHPTLGPHPSCHCCQSHSLGFSTISRPELGLPSLRCHSGWRSRTTPPMCFPRAQLRWKAAHQLPQCPPAHHTPTPGHKDSKQSRTAWSTRSSLVTGGLAQPRQRESHSFFRQLLRSQQVS